MMVFAFFFFVFLFVYQGVDIFLFSVSIYFLYEVFFGLDFGFLSGSVFCGGWGYVLCILSIIIVILMFFSGGVSRFFKPLYLVLMWLILVGLLFCFKVNDFFLFYLAFEFVVIPVFLMMLLFGYSVDRVLAALYMFLYTLLTSLPFLYYLLYISVDTCSLSLIYDEMFVDKPGLDYDWWIYLMLLVFMVKYPVFVLHLWLPSAHVEAPVSGSMILAGVMLKLGAYGMLSLFIFNGGLIFYVSSLLGAFSLLGVGLICLFMIRQLDVSMMVAYSSIVHMGPVFVSILYGFEYGLLGGIFMLLAHGLCSSALFYALNLGYERHYSRSLLLMRGGLVFSPVLSYWWFFLCISNMGCPPTFNFISEILMMWGLIYMSYFFAFFIFLLGFFVGVYCIYMYEYFNHGMMLVDSSFFVLRHLEIMIIFIHSFPILVGVGFLGECF